MKTLFRYLLIWVLLIVSLPMMTACSDDESTDPYDINYGFVYNPSVTEHSIFYLEDGTILTLLNEVENLTQVRCTRPAPNDLVYTVSIDKSLVDTYNEKNGTDYVFLENAELLQSTYIIRKGEYISQDTIKVNYSDVSEFTNGSKNYILPVTVSSISDGVELSESRTFYLTYHSTMIFVEESVEPLGTEITNRTEWTVLLNGTPRSEITDGSVTNYLYIPDTSVLDIDLGKIESLTTIGFRFYAWYYSCANVSLSVSMDGVNYEDMGVIEFTTSNPSRYIHFFNPKQAQYIRMTLNGYFYSSNYSAFLRELYFYVAE